MILSNQGCDKKLAKTALPCSATAGDVASEEMKAGEDDNPGLPACHHQIVLQLPHSSLQSSWCSIGQHHLQHTFLSATTENFNLYFITDLKAAGNIVGRRSTILVLVAQAHCPWPAQPPASLPHLAAI